MFIQLRDENKKLVLVNINFIATVRATVGPANTYIELGCDSGQSDIACQEEVDEVMGKIEHAMHCDGATHD